MGQQGEHSGSNSSTSNLRLRKPQCTQTTQERATLWSGGETRSNSTVHSSIEWVLYMSQQFRVNKVYHEECPKSNKYAVLRMSKTPNKVYPHVFHLLRGLQTLAERSIVDALACSGSIKSPVVIDQGSEVSRARSAPQKPSMVTFPGLILFLVGHAIGITASVITHCKLMLGIMVDYKSPRPLLCP